MKFLFCLALLCTPAYGSESKAGESKSIEFNSFLEARRDALQEQQQTSGMVEQLAQTQQELLKRIETLNLEAKKSDPKSWEKNTLLRMKKLDQKYSKKNYSLASVEKLIEQNKIYTERVRQLIQIIESEKK